ncbi:MAG: hypothetical protein ACFCU6_05545 [Balneolaceae bacterium]
MSRSTIFLFLIYLWLCSPVLAQQADSEHPPKTLNTAVEIEKIDRLLELMEKNTRDHPNSVLQFHNELNSLLSVFPNPSIEAKQLVHTGWAYLYLPTP